MRLPTRQTFAATPQVLGPMLLVAMFAGVAFIYLAACRMAATSTAAPADGETPRPSAADDEETRPLNRVSIQLTLARAKPQWIVGGRTIDRFADVQKLLTDIAAADPTAYVTLDIAPEISLGDAVDLYDACRQVHLDRVEIAVTGAP